MKIPTNLGMLLLAIWLIVSGVMFLVPSLAFQGSGNVLALIAIAAGILLLIKR